MHDAWEGLKPLIVMLVLMAPGIVPGIIMMYRKDK